MNLKEFFMMVAGPPGNGYVHIRSEGTLDSTIEEFGVDPYKYDENSLQQAFTQKSQDEQRNMWFQVGAVDAPDSKKARTAGMVWADCDVYKYPGGEPQVMGLLRQLPTPTVIVRSGRGLHIYWQLTEPVDADGPMSTAQTLAKSVQWMLGADAAHSPSKLLRVPGTFNFKPGEYEGGLPCEIIETHPVKYEPKDFPIDDTLMKIGHKLMSKIMLGPTDVATDRSEYDYHLVSELLKAGFTAQEITGLMMKYPFSGKVHDRETNKAHYIDRTIKSCSFRIQIAGPSRTPKDPVSWAGKTLTEILKEEKPPFIVNDFLPTAGVAMIAAPPKARKSWCVMQLAYAVATGTEWLGFDVSQKRKVLYVQAELPNWMVAERMVQMYGESNMDNILFYHIPAANLIEDDDLQGLLDAVRETGAELVIIDPVANFWQGDENSSSSVNQLFDQVAKLQALGAAVVLVHHSRKTEANELLSPQHQRGSNVFFARPAAVMTLSPMLFPGEVPHTIASFALRAAAPKDNMKLFTDPAGKFTLDEPSIGGSAVKSMLLEKLRAKKAAEQQESNILMYNGS